MKGIINSHPCGNLGQVIVETLFGGVVTRIGLHGRIISDGSISTHYNK